MAIVPPVAMEAISRISSLRYASWVSSARWATDSAMTEKQSEVTTNSSWTSGSPKKSATRPDVATPRTVSVAPIPAAIQNTVERRSRSSIVGR